MNRRERSRKKRLPKKEYFEKRLKEAESSGLKEKAKYYRKRLKELTPNSIKFILEFLERA